MTRRTYLHRLCDSMTLWKRKGVSVNPGRAITQRRRCEENENCVRQREHQSDKNVGNSNGSGLDLADLREKRSNLRRLFRGGFRRGSKNALEKELRWGREKGSEKIDTWHFEQGSEKGENGRLWGGGFIYS